MKYYAFLRAVNVGKRQMKMSELQKMMESLGFTQVRTFIASGNVVFESEEKDIHSIVQSIEQEIEKVFGYDVTVVLRSTHELQEIIENNPFRNTPLTTEIILYVTFLKKAPDAERVTLVERSSLAAYKNKVCGKELYTLRDKRKDENGLKGMSFEADLGVRGTTRNWNTILRLSAL